MSYCSYKYLCLLKHKLVWREWEWEYIVYVNFYWFAYKQKCLNFVQKFHWFNSIYFHHSGHFPRELRFGNCINGRWRERLGRIAAHRRRKGNISVRGLLLNLKGRKILGHVFASRSLGFSSGAFVKFDARLVVRLASSTTSLIIASLGSRLRLRRWIIVSLAEAWRLNWRTLSGQILVETRKGHIRSFQRIYVDIISRELVNFVANLDRVRVF